MSHDRGGDRDRGRDRDGERDVVHMRRALELAARGWGRVQPNPMVGAVIVRDGRVVAEGLHTEWGGAHAEIAALAEAGSAARGAVLYTNLEPCHHSGKTGPCSRAIAEAGIRRVVYGVSDPNPEAAGGTAWLEGTGIEVESGVCEQAARDLNAIHMTTYGEGRSFLALKYALSLDARLSRRPGTTVSVTGEEARRESHRLRAGHDSIMVGIGTVLADDPRLTVREWRGPSRAPVRVVLDSDLRLPAGSALARSTGTAPVWVLASAQAPRDREARLASLGVEVIRVRQSVGSGGLELGAVLDQLWSRGIRSILCEGGGALGSAWLAAGRVDRLYLFIAPRLFGEPGVAAFQEPLDGAVREWRLVSRGAAGPDTLLVLAPDDRGA